SDHIYRAASDFEINLYINICGACVPVPTCTAKKLRNQTAENNEFWFSAVVMYDSNECCFGGMACCLRAYRFIDHERSPLNARPHLHRERQLSADQHIF